MHIHKRIAAYNPTMQGGIEFHACMDVRVLSWPTPVGPTSRANPGFSPCGPPLTLRTNIIPVNHHYILFLIFIINALIILYHHLLHFLHFTFNFLRCVGVGRRPYLFVIIAIFYVFISHFSSTQKCNIGNYTLSYRLIARSTNYNHK